ncbi:DNA ligase 3 [Trichoplax sp. H2]|nr:DNA ligase 3 [Trichoplax sp. H2]|eukprot:RDD44029.1 DNA ligase 3 [Trichoplax sp. H2]
MLPLFTSTGRPYLRVYFQIHLASLSRLRLLSNSIIAMPIEFLAEYDRSGRASCKGCKQKLEKKALRIAKVVENPFGDTGETMKQWHHPKCIFNSFIRARPATKIIQTVADIDGYDDLEDDDQESVSQMITDCLKERGNKQSKKKMVQQSIPFAKAGPSGFSKPNSGWNNSKKAYHSSTSNNNNSQDDNSFQLFTSLCDKIGNVGSYLAKTKVVADLLKMGSNGNGYEGDIYLLMKLLLPGIEKRVYNLQSRQLIKLFSQIFVCDYDEMLEDLDKGDVAETITDFFANNTAVAPLNRSLLTMQEVDDLLDELSNVTKEDMQLKVLKKIARRCTTEDLRYIIRLIKHDLRINAGSRHILDALDKNAHAAYQASSDLRDVVDRCLARKTDRNNDDDDGAPKLKRDLSIRASLMTPVRPMLAEACKSINTAIKKCPKGMFAEIKYDGERVQIHKNGQQFEYYSRSLKQVMPHKVKDIKQYLPQACPHGNSIILDSEVLLVDKTGKPLPFGTLGVHKKQNFSDATVCLFIFDCLHFNGKDLMQTSIIDRRKILESNVQEIPGRIMLSEKKLVQKENELTGLVSRVIREGLEGLVLKDVESVYEPGKRHWLKIKKDYLAEGSMADSADLVVLGAYYGTGNKGGVMSVFLMGTYDERSGRWRTVAKCGNGHDDKTLDKINKELSVVKISKDFSKVPGWLNVHRSLVPDFIVTDPKTAPVWEITGAEFSQSTVHTADGISIRFPRVTRIRDDKDWTNATNLDRLKTLYENSKDASDIADSLLGVKKEVDDEGECSSSSSPDKTVTRKRKVEELEKEKTTIADNKVISKIPCKYGPNCYRKNGEHLANYSHNKENGNSSPNACGSQIKQGLPNFFHGLKFVISSDVPHQRNITRHIIAFDGDVLDEFKEDQADHIIVNSNRNKKDDSSKYMTASEFWDFYKKSKQS